MVTAEPKVVLYNCQYFTASTNRTNIYNKTVCMHLLLVYSGNTKGGSITFGLDLSVLQIKTKIVSCHTADSKPFKREVSGTVILPPFVFPGQSVIDEKK